MIREDFRKDEDVRLVEEGREDLGRSAGQYSEQYHRNKVTTDMAYMRTFGICNDFEHFSVVQVNELLVIS